MSVVLRFPTAEEEERSKRFQVNKNYLSSIAQYLEHTYGPDPTTLHADLLNAQQQLAGFRRIQRIPVVRAEEIARLLRISWASEIQLRLGLFGKSAYLRYSNVWAPVHAYYAVYMSTHAWFSAMKFGQLIDDHSSSLRTVAMQVKNRDLFPLPWAVSCGGCPQLKECSWARLPDGADPHAQVELLANPSLEDFWPRYCKMLETTRARRLEGRFDDWRRRRHRKNIRAAEKRDIERNLWPTTMFDVLFRLRVRSNYRDIASFLMSSVSLDWQAEFLQSLLVATETTTLLLESLIVRTVGTKVYTDALDEFLHEDMDQVDEPAAWLLERRSLLAPSAK